MEKDKTLAYKSRKFAVCMIKLHRYLNEEKKEYVLSKQLLRSGTSIGANLAESECAISKKDFLSKLYIAFKEANERVHAAASVSIRKHRKHLIVPDFFRISRPYQGFHETRSKSGFSEKCQHSVSMKPCGLVFRRILRRCGYVRHQLFRRLAASAKAS